MDRTTAFAKFTAWTAVSGAAIFLAVPHFMNRAATFDALRDVVGLLALVVIGLALHAIFPRE